MLSCVWLFETPWTVTCQAPLSVGLFKQDYWSGLPSLSPADLPDLGTEPVSPKSPAFHQVGLLPAEPPGKLHYNNKKMRKPRASLWEHTVLWYFSALVAAICGCPGDASGKKPTCQSRRHETRIPSLCQEDPLEEGVATLSSTLAWRIPWTEEPGRL